MTRPLPYALAAVLGVAYQWTAQTFWGYYVMNSPVQAMLAMEHGAYSYAHDLMLNLLIAIPFAAVLRYVPALRSWRNVAVAVGVALLLTYGPGAGSLSAAVAIPRFWAGVVHMALSIPAAFFVLNSWGAGWRSSNRVHGAA